MARGLFLALLLLSSFVPFVHALEGEHIIANSEDWRDVYSTMLYATLSGKANSFLTSTSYGPTLLNGISTENSIGVVTSSRLPFVINYPSIIEPRGYPSVDEIVVDEANLELIDEPELASIDSFIIVGDSYGYNAIAVAPYATLTNSWVFFANRINIAEVESVLARKNPSSVIIYGYVDRDVLDSLEQFDPEVINTGDRFNDNVEIVKRFKEVQDVTQVTLTNGEFLEQEAMNSRHPILFTGRQNVPDTIAEYLRESDITVGVLIGNELIQAATNIRRTAGISVMVKFARSARARTSGIAAVQGLDLFPLPTPVIDLGIQSIRYNQLSQSLEVTYQSRSNVPLYLKGTISLQAGSELQRMGDVEPVYMAPNDYKTLSYPDIQVDTSEELTASINTLFGEVASSLDRELTGSLEVGVINVLDKCEIDVDKVTYVKQSELFKISVDNVGDVDCYVDVEFSDIRINNVRQVIGTEGSEFIGAGKSGAIELDQRMEDEDLEENPFIDLVAYHGEREDSLVKIFKGKYELRVRSFNTITYVMIVLLILLLLLALIIFFLRRRDDGW